MDIKVLERALEHLTEARGAEQKVVKARGKRESIGESRI